MAPIKLKSIILFLSIIAVYGTNAVSGHHGTISNTDSCPVSDISANPTLLPTNNNNSFQYYLYTPEHPNELCYLESDVSGTCEFNLSANSTGWLPTNDSNSIQYHLYTREHPNELCYLEPDVSNSCEINMPANPTFGLPTNENNSIQYHLYTPEHPNEFCYFEPNVSNNCEFNARYKFKILIHGFTVQLLPGNLFEQIKDIFLEYDTYNVIIVNWTQYDGNVMEEYPIVALMAYPIAIDVGQMINFLVMKGVNPLDIHVIGHSLGAHIAGVAGKQVPNLGRVTGLDPAGPLFSREETFNRLTNTSARLVDVIHTSNYLTCVGLGFPYAIGSVDFYPNSGNVQPACHMGGQYLNSDAELVTITTWEKLACCYHDIALLYFMNSIRVCNYPSVECESYKTYSAGGCDVLSNPTNKMGFFCELIPGLPAESTFYLNTSAESPYCEI